jgi:hypothetical protein
MRFARNLIIFLSLFILSCAVPDPYIRNLSENDIDSLLKTAPRAEDHVNAGASLLNSYTYVEFNSDGTSFTRNLFRMKIFNERGRNFASTSISYREGYQEVKVLFANTIKPDGRIIPLNHNDIHDASEYAGYEFYTDIKTKRFTMPAVEDGCIIEYAYEIKNLKPILSLDYFATFFCRNIFPIEEDILEIVLPANTELKYKNFITTLAPEISMKGNKKRYVFINAKQKEIIPETRMPSLYDRDTFPQLSLWTLDSWQAISKWYINLVSQQMKPDKELEEFTRQLIAGKKTDEEKINAIFNFVSQNIRYIAVLLGPHTHKPHQVSEIFQKRYGDCKDKTVLLLTMLKIAGIEGMPALVPANGKYFDETIPSLSAFNHIIAVVPFGDKYFWMDATNETAAYNSAPFSLPTKVLLMKFDGSHQIIETPALDDTKDYFSAKMEYIIDTEGNASVHSTYTYFGKAAEPIRYYFKYSPPEQRKIFFERRGLEVKDLFISSFTDTQEPFTIQVSGKMKNLAQVLDEEMMVLSNIISSDTYQDITSSPGRIYPIDLKQSFFSQENYSYKFPAGFKIKRLPKNYTFKTPFRHKAEKYSFKNSTFIVNLETKNSEKIINVNDINHFKNYALELQKHESSIKNIIFEKK